MSRTKHTPEPWWTYVRAGRTLIRSTYKQHGAIATLSGCGERNKADADRTVSCVNACAGLNLPDDVEMGAVTEALSAAAAYQRRLDEITTKDFGGVGLGGDGAERLRLIAALAKLEGK